MPTGNANSVPSADPASPAAASTQPTTGSNNANPATQLSEVIDEFLADVEKKFKGMNDEILAKLDDMAERCDRLESELLLKEGEGGESTSAPTENSS